MTAVAVPADSENPVRPSVGGASRAHARLSVTGTREEAASRACRQPLPTSDWLDPSRMGVGRSPQRRRGVDDVAAQQGVGRGVSQSPAPFEADFGGPSGHELFGACRIRNVDSRPGAITCCKGAASTRVGSARRTVGEGRPDTPVLALIAYRDDDEAVANRQRQTLRARRRRLHQRSQAGPGRRHPNPHGSGGDQRRRHRARGTRPNGRAPSVLRSRAGPGGQ